jgi:LmbE family N-acetylglucosaminyl deacetylase
MSSPERSDRPLRLLAVTAHPDDESLGMGGVLAKYAAEGVEVSILAATRGERGRYRHGEDHPGEQELGRIREAELRAAARELGAKAVTFLDYLDRDLDRADPRDAVGKIANHLRASRPQVVVTFGPDGAYGHPDHIAISQYTTAAITAAAATGARGRRAHVVSKLYYMAWPAGIWAAYQAAFKKMVSRVDGVERQAVPWPDWALTTRIDTAQHWPQVWRAVQCHESQMVAYEALGSLPPELHRELWGVQHYYRAVSLVNGGRALETDLFAGLRD